MWVCQGFIQWQHKVLCFVLRALSDDVYCFLVPELILVGPISWFFSTLWNVHWVVHSVSHPLNSFPSIKALFLQPPSDSLVVFGEEPSKSPSGEPNLWCPLDPLYQPTDTFIEPRQEFPLQVPCQPFPNRLSWSVTFLCITDSTVTLRLEVRLGSQCSPETLFDPLL